MIAQWSHLTSRPVAEPKGSPLGSVRMLEGKQAGSASPLSMQPLSFCCSFRIKGLSKLIHLHASRGPRQEGAFCSSIAGNEDLAEHSLVLLWLLLLLCFSLWIWSFSNKNKQVSQPGGQQSLVMCFLLERPSRVHALSHRLSLLHVEPSGVGRRYRVQGGLTEILNNPSH